jgi:hypothetical protein
MMIARIACYGEGSAGFNTEICPKAMLKDDPSLCPKRRLLIDMGAASIWRSPPPATIEVSEKRTRSKAVVHNDHCKPLACWDWK